MWEEKANNFFKVLRNVIESTNLESVNLNESQFQYMTIFPLATSSLLVIETKTATYMIAIVWDVCKSVGKMA